MNNDVEVQLKNVVSSEQFMAVSQLRESLKKNEALLLQVLPSNTGGKISDQERNEIQWYYQNGHYTQETLTGQYQVS